VYSRRLNKNSDLKNNVPAADKAEKRRDLLLKYSMAEDRDFASEPDFGIVPSYEQQAHRRLLFGINWDAGAGMTDAKQHWADMRSQAINSLVRYFGSLNSGSIGWCEGTQWYDPKKDGKCEPVMAKQGWLTWMDTMGEPKDECP
jgi:hypothetical protein